jgi:hypothetical protein
MFLDRFAEPCYVPNALRLRGIIIMTTMPTIGRALPPGLIPTNGSSLTAAFRLTKPKDQFMFKIEDSIQGHLVELVDAADEQWAEADLAYRGLRRLGVSCREANRLSGRAKAQRRYRRLFRWCWSLENTLLECAEVDLREKVQIVARRAALGLNVSAELNVIDC